MDKITQWIFLYCFMSLMTLFLLTGLRHSIKWKGRYIFFGSIFWPVSFFYAVCLALLDIAKPLKERIIDNW